MEDTIVQTLIEYYKERRIDVSALVGNPLFTTLPVKNQVDLLKKYAAEISQHTSKGVSRAEIKDALTEAGISAAISGAAAGVGVAQALQYYTGGKIPFSTIAKLTAIGAGLGAAGSAFSTVSSMSNRRAIRSGLETVAKNPTDANAIKLIITRNSLGPVISRTSLLAKAKGEFDNYSNDFQKNRIKPEASYETFVTNSDAGTNLKPGVDTKAFTTTFEAARDTRNKYKFKT